MGYVSSLEGKWQFFSVNHVILRFLELDLELVNTEHPDGQVGFLGYGLVPL